MALILMGDWRGPAVRTNRYENRGALPGDHGLSELNKKGIGKILTGRFVLLQRAG